jgi:hypothetical protein
VLCIDDAAGSGEGARVCCAPVLFVSRGRILDRRFTIHFHGITEGATVFGFCPSSGIRRYGCIPRPIRWISLTGVAPSVDDTARLIDRSYANWEMRKEYPAVLETILQTADKDKRETALPGEATIIAASPEISDRPLPPLRSDIGA